MCHQKIISKNNIKKSDNYNDKAEQQALKEAEIIAELAPNEKTRREAEKLIETVENGSTTTLQEAKETISNHQAYTIAQDSSEIFDTYKKGILKPFYSSHQHKDSNTSENKVFPFIFPT